MDARGNPKFSRIFPCGHKQRPNRGHKQCPNPTFPPVAISRQWAICRSLGQDSPAGEGVTQGLRRPGRIRCQAGRDFSVIRIGWLSGSRYLSGKHLRLQRKRTIDRRGERVHEEGRGSRPWSATSPATPVASTSDGSPSSSIWVTTKVPRDFGFLRSCWCCGTLARLRLSSYELEVGPETVRRCSHRGNLVSRRPRPTVGPRDKQRAAKLVGYGNSWPNCPPTKRSSGKTTLISKPTPRSAGWAELFLYRIASKSWVL
jgi:hypothetical protein